MSLKEVIFEKKIIIGSVTGAIATLIGVIAVFFPSVFNMEKKSISTDEFIISNTKEASELWGYLQSNANKAVKLKIGYCSDVSHLYSANKKVLNGLELEKGVNSDNGDTWSPASVEHFNIVAGGNVKNIIEGEGNDPDTTGIDLKDPTLMFNSGKIENNFWKVNQVSVVGDANYNWRIGRPDVAYNNILNDDDKAFIAKINEKCKLTKSSNVFYYSDDFSANEASDIKWAGIVSGIFFVNPPVKVTEREGETGYLPTVLLEKAEIDGSNDGEIGEYLELSVEAPFQLVKLEPLSQKELEMKKY